jgi:hypothetical protein
MSAFEIPLLFKEIKNPPYRQKRDKGGYLICFFASFRQHRSANLLCPRVAANQR